MTADRALTPADAAVAVRSFPRRFRGLLDRPGDDERLDPDEVARRPGSAGLAAIDHVASADALLRRLEGGLRRREPVTVEAPRPPTVEGSVQALLDRLQSTAEEAASRVEAIPNDAWVELLPSTQDVVGAVADHLRAMRQVLSEVIR